jgi:hypothetical protein
MLSDKDVKSFIEIYKNRFNKELSYEEATQKANTLLRMVELIYKPMTVQEYNNLQKRRKETGDI